MRVNPQVERLFLSVWKFSGLFGAMLSLACGEAVEHQHIAGSGADVASLSAALSAASSEKANASPKGPKAGRGGSGGSGGAGGSNAEWMLVKNWDFGSDGGNTIHDLAELSAEFQYHDHWGTIDNGGNYGAAMVAEQPGTELAGQRLDPGGEGKFREITATSLRTYVRPLDPGQSTVSVSSHNAGCGSIVAKWSLPGGGAQLGQDMKWETRLRMPKPLSAYWLAIWNAGTLWNNGPELDVMESFGTPNINHDAFHSNTVGGTDTINYASWPNGLTAAGVPNTSEARDLTLWHTWTLEYRKDDSYEVRYDNWVVQRGTIPWITDRGRKQPTDLHFLIDLGWGHVKIADVNITLPASAFPLEYEVDYSRVWLR